MSDPVRRDSDAEVIQLYRKRHQNPTAVLSGGGGGGTSDDMLQRVEALEKNFAEVGTKLDAILKSVTAGHLDAEKRFSGIDKSLAVIDVKLDNKASSEKLEALSKDMHLGVQSVDRELRTKAASTDLEPITTRLGTLDGRLANIPTFWNIFFLMFGSVLTTLVGLSGLAALYAKYLR